MGKIRPKLSQVIQREFEVRRQLGLRPNDTRVTGRKGAARAEQELQRRLRLRRKHRIGWNNLCYELQDMVLVHLSIADLAAIREAGFGGCSVANRQRLRDVMRKRCRQLKPLWKIWTRGTPKYQTKADREGCMPVEFTSQVSRLCLSPRVGGVPDSICEMKALKYLDVGRHLRPMFGEMPQPLRTLPDSLRSCQGLLELRLSHHEFEEIPDCVLALKMLRRLEMARNVKLKRLPPDIGERLKSLNYLNIRGCRGVKSLPESLLRRLEQALGGRQRHRVPLLLTGDYFPNNYLAETISTDKFPKLSAYLENGAMTSPEIDFVHDLLFNDAIVGAP